MKMARQQTDAVGLCQPKGVVMGLGFADAWLSMCGVDSANSLQSSFQLLFLLRPQRLRESFKLHDSQYGA